MKVTKKQHKTMWCATGIIVLAAMIPSGAITFASPFGQSLGSPLWLWMSIQFGPAVAWFGGFFLYLATMPEE